MTLYQVQMKNGLFWRNVGDAWALHTIAHQTAREIRALHQCKARVQVSHHNPFGWRNRWCYHWAVSLGIAALMWALIMVVTVAGVLLI